MKFFLVRLCVFLVFLSSCGLVCHEGLFRGAEDGFVVFVVTTWKGIFVVDYWDHSTHTSQ